ncbi:MAG: restriction endonuclease subunit S [Candidatus Thiodiazotropha sp.]
MREGWETKFLGEAIRLEYGKPLPKEKRDDAGKYLAYGANGVKCRTNEYFYDKPSIIVGRKGSAGEVTLTEEKFWPLDVTYYVTFDEKKYDLIFLHHCLKSLKLTRLAKGVKPGINRNDVYQIKFNFPPLPEQKRIVSILDEAFEGIEQATKNAEKNLLNARELFDSYLNFVFSQKAEGWVETTLGNLCDFLNGFAFKSTDAVKTSNVQLIRMGNLYQNVLDLDRKPSFYPDNFAEEYSRYVLSEGDLIMSLTGTVDKQDYGFTVEIPATDRVLLLNQRIAKFVNIREDKIDRRYFLHFLRSRSFLEELYSSARGVRQANLSSVSMKKLAVSYPDIKTQRVLVKKFDVLKTEVVNLEAIYKQKLNDLAELKQSLLQKAFAGELTANNVVSFPNAGTRYFDTASPEFSAHVLAYAHYWHASQKREKTFGRVKAQKFLHLTESVAHVDLGR